MSWDQVCESLCPIARALAVVGDRWTLLILRELTMGVHRFDEMQAQTGMSSHLLASRLKRLEIDGVIERRPYSERPVRYEYHATAKGKELDPVLLLLRQWGMKWGSYAAHEAPAVTLVHKKTRALVDAGWRPPAGKKGFTFDDVEGSPSAAFQAERAARRAAFQADKGGARKKAPGKTASR